MKHIGFALFALAWGGWAHAECSTQPIKVEAAGSTLGVFDAAGKFQSELPKSALTPTATVVDCNEDLGLIQVNLGNGDTKWLDRGDLRLTFAQGSAPKPVCVDAANTRASDHTEAAVSGIDPNSTQSCVPSAP